MDHTALSSAAFPRSTWLRHLDPRTRIVTAVVYTVLVSVLRDGAALAASLVAAGGLTAWSGLPARMVFRRLAVLNSFLVVLGVVLALTAPSAAPRTLGRAAYSPEGCDAAVRIAVRANAMVLAAMSLLSTLSASTLAHALQHLRVPQKLTQLLIFTIRYIDVLRREQQRLRAAMKVRGFRPRSNLHTYRTYGYLAGMLLVRGVARSERIVAAMKCRGFRGRFFVLDHFAASRADAAFAVFAALSLCGIAWLEWHSRWLVGGG